MATREEALSVVLDKIVEMTPGVASELNARAVLDLAEAAAWIQYPNQPHGGNSVTKTS